jgi:hypothetical protein
MLAPLSAYLDGHESGSGEVAVHLEHCERCRATLESYREAGHRFRGLTPLAPLAGVLARVGDAFRGGVEGPAAVAVASLATAAVLAASGGGALIAKDLVSSGTPRVAVVAPVAHVAAVPVAARPLVRRTRTPAPPIHERRPPRTAHVRASAPAPVPVVRTAPSSTPAAAPAPPVTAPVPTTTATTTTPAETPAATTPAVPPRVTTPVTPVVPVVAPVVDTVEKVLRRPVSVPSVTTPAVRTPAVEVPAVTVPSVTTPAIATPVATVPSLTTPAITTPSVSVAPIATPVITTPEIRVPPIKVGPLG